MAHFSSPNMTEDQGGFNFLDFVYLMKKLRNIRKQRREAELRELFKQYDKDGSGELGPAEINLILEDFDLLPKSKEEQEEIAGILDVRQVMRMLRRNISSDQLRALFEHLDDDESGQMEMEEFLHLMRMVEDGSFLDVVKA